MSSGVDTNNKQEFLIETDVLIVGYGPIGAAVAALLGKYGIATTVIDRAKGILNMPRAVGMDNEGLRIVQMAGLSDTAFETFCVNKTRMISQHFGEFAQFNMSGVVNGHARQVMYFQPELEKALRAQVKGYENISVLHETELLSLNDNGQSVRANICSKQRGQGQIQAKYVVGADGASSTVRKILGIEFEGKSYAENWLIVDAKNLPEMNDHIDFYCGSNRPGPHLPGAGDRQRWEFMLAADDCVDEMEKPERIKELLSPWGDPALMEIERQAVYQFHARSCQQFSKGRVFLVGDAAHITPPFLGQGLVAGLRDAANLSWKLAWVLKGIAAPCILDSYDEERRPHAIHMIKLAKFLGFFIRPASELQAKLAHGAVRAIRLIPPVKAYVDGAKLKPEHHFSSGLFVKSKKRFGMHRVGAKPGELFPQALVRNSIGKTLMSDDALGEHLSIVGLGVDPHEHLSIQDIERWQSMGGNFLKISQRSQHSDTESYMFEDLTGDFIPDAAHFGKVLVVRPDRAVVTSGDVNDISSMIETTQQLLMDGCNKKSMFRKIYEKVA